LKFDGKALLFEKKEPGCREKLTPDWINFSNEVNLLKIISLKIQLNFFNILPKKELDGTFLYEWPVAERPLPVTLVLTLKLVAKLIFFYSILNYDEKHLTFKELDFKKSRKMALEIPEVENFIGDITKNYLENPNELQHSDVLLVCGKGSYPVHKFILSCRYYIYTLRNSFCDFFISFCLFIHTQI